MEGKVKAGNAEKIIVLFTALFFVLLLGLYIKDVGGTGGEGVTVETQYEADKAAIAPELVYYDPNIATEEELATLPGIGAVLAQRICKDREENGAFLQPEDLLRVNGIGEKKLEAILPYLSIE